MTSRTRTRGLISRLFTVLALALALPLFAPAALAFPYRVRVGDTVVYAETPISPQITTVLARADRLREASPLNGPGYARQIVLTEGGWRWTWLGLGASGAFALTRPLTATIVVDGSDVARDRVNIHRAVGNVRSLSGVLAHEQTHGLIRARYGLLAPAWLREGYGDVVARESALTDAQAAMLERRGEAHPALLYYHGRKRVEALLRASGGSVDRVFAGARLW